MDKQQAIATQLSRGNQIGKRARSDRAALVECIVAEQQRVRMPLLSPVVGPALIAVAERRGNSRTQVDGRKNVILWEETRKEACCQTTYRACDRLPMSRGTTFVLHYHEWHGHDKRKGYPRQDFRTGCGIKTTTRSDTKQH